MKGKKNLIIEFNGNQFLYFDFKVALERKCKEHGAKYSDNVDMYFNVNQGIVYCVSDGNKFEIRLEDLYE